jgi:hypothetical protein
MRWRREPKPTRLPGEYPESFVKHFMARTLPAATPAEAASAVRHLRGKGWTEEQLAEFILPYMPRGAPGQGRGSVADERPAHSQAPPHLTHAEPAQAAHPCRALPLPPDVTRPWLDEHLPALDRHQLRGVVDELEHRGWPTGTVAMVVLPHLLPKLSDEDGRAIVAGLGDLGMSAEEIARATTSQ